MQVTSTFSSGTASGASSSDLAKLQKQLRDLTNELRNVATSSLEVKAKIEKSKLLQAQIQLVQAEIAAIQLAKQQKQQATQANSLKAPDPVTLKHKKSDASTQATLGKNVDTFA